jgi:hypothetical protein
MKTFESITDMEAASLKVGQIVKCNRITSGGDLVGNLLFNIVAGGTGVTDEGYIDLANGNQAECVTGKFTLAYDQSRGRTFASIYNWVDDENILSLADNTSSGDAHVAKLPFDVRRDSHALVATAGTFGGSNDIDFRTSAFSDYILLTGNSVYQGETFSVLFDTFPSRNDGTKKDGTGLGGLTPSEDQYAFDSAMTIPSNGTDTPVTFPALGVRFEQYMELKERSTGTHTYRFTPDTATTTLTETSTGNELGELSEDAVKLGAKSFISTDQNNPLGVDGAINLSRTLSLSSGVPVVFQLTSGSNSVATGNIKAMGIGSGGASFGVYHASFSTDGTTLTADNNTGTLPALPAQITAVLAMNSGVLELTLSYSGGLGGSARVAVDIDYIVRTW